MRRQSRPGTRGVKLESFHSKPVNLSDWCQCWCWCWLVVNIRPIWFCSVITGIRAASNYLDRISLPLMVLRLLSCAIRTPQYYNIFEYSHYSSSIAAVYKYSNLSQSSIVSFLICKDVYHISYGISYIRDIFQSWGFWDLGFNWYGDIDRIIIIWDQYLFWCNGQTHH